MGDASVVEVARLLVAAENPVVIAGRHAQPAGHGALHRVRRGAAGAGDQATCRVTPHYQPGGQRNADVILGPRSRISGHATTVRDQLSDSPGLTPRPAEGAEHQYRRVPRTNTRFPAPGLISITADAEATLPVLIEAVKRLLTSTGPRFRIAERCWRRRRAPCAGASGGDLRMEFQSDQPGASSGRGARKHEDWAGGRELANFQWDYTKLPVRSLRSAQGAEAGAAVVGLLWRIVHGHST